MTISKKINQAIKEIQQKRTVARVYKNVQTVKELLDNVLSVCRLAQVVRSCETPEQIENAEKWLKNYLSVNGLYDDRMYDDTIISLFVLCQTVKIKIDNDLNKCNKNLYM